MTMIKRAFVLLSGGLDSTTCLHLAMKDFGKQVEAVSFNYGQRHGKEMEYARRSCDAAGITHTILDLGGLLSGDGVMLTDSRIEVPNIAYGDIKGVSPTYVPFRNGTMLSILAAFAQKYSMAQIAQHIESLMLHFIGADYTDNTRAMMRDHYKKVTAEEARDLCWIYAGMHAEDAQNHAYPDCTFEFLGAIASAITTGTYGAVRLLTPFAFSSKADIVRAGARLGVDFANTWSCYKGKPWQCGNCPTCLSRKDAFAAASIEDPTHYYEDEERKETTIDALATPPAPLCVPGEVDDEIPF